MSFTSNRVRPCVRWLIASAIALGTSQIAMAARTANPVVVQTAAYAGNTYHLLSEASWEDSEAAAVTLGGHLVTVDDAAENQFLFNTFGPTANSLGAGGGTISLWLGLNDAVSEGSYAWASGQAVAYTQWIPGQPQNVFGPDEDYAGLMLSDPAAGWHDVVGDTRFGDRTFGVVEVSAVPEPAALLLFLSGMGLLGWRRRPAR